MSARGAAGDPGLNALDWMNRAALHESGFAEVMVASSAGRQTCFTAGSGQTLLLVHGAGDHAGTWAKAVAPLLAAGRYRIVIPDLAGHGTSEPAGGRLEMEMFLAGLAPLMEHAAGRPAILVGNSFGAWLAMIWAEKHPGRVERVIAVNGGPVSGARADLTLTPSDRVEARRLWESLVDEAHWAVPDVVLDELIRKGREGALVRLSVENLQPYLMDRRLGEFPTPVDVLWGEADRLLPLEYARKLHAGLPAARLTTIARCGHVPQVECPDRFNALLGGVLDMPPPARSAA